MTYRPLLSLMFALLLLPLASADPPGGAQIGGEAFGMVHEAVEGILAEAPPLCNDNDPSSETDPVTGAVSGCYEYLFGGGTIGPIECLPAYFTLFGQNLPVAVGIDKGCIEDLPGFIIWFVTHPENLLPGTP